MKVHFGAEQLNPPPEGMAVTIGTFDGVHLGHRALIAETLADAEDLGCFSAAITWDRHPMTTLRPDKAPPLLSTPERKRELLAETGIDDLLVLAFDEGFSHMSPEDFVTAILVERLGVRSIRVGHDWRFGHRAAGDVDLLKKMAVDHGFEVAGADLMEVSDAPVTSSRIRAAIGDGDLELAARLLGRPYDVDGIVVSGASRGRSLGFPTANLGVEQTVARPPLGIYAGLAHIGEASRPAAISVGTNPTFGESDSVRIEAYLLDFDEEIYERSVRLEFWKRLRDERRFVSVEELVAQMERDVEATRALVSPRSA